jgi:hypothetical protein
MLGSGVLQRDVEGRIECGDGRVFEHTVDASCAMSFWKSAWFCQSPREQLCRRILVCVEENAHVLAAQNS